MTRFIILLILVFTLYSCNESPTTDNNVLVEKIEPTIPEEDTFIYDTLQGMYIGDFGGSDIRIILNYVSQKNAIGYNIHKGLQRNINGKVSRSGDSIELILQEPGDNEYDGVFTINFIDNYEMPTGEWKSNSGKIPTRQFTLRKLIKPDVINEDEINFSNFANHFGYLSDTIGDYQFKSDGLCTFEYYPEQGDDDNMVEQLVEVLGTWTLDGTQVIVDWQPNKVFTDRKMELEIFQTEWEEITLKNGDQVFYNHYYGP